MIGDSGGMSFAGGGAGLSLQGTPLLEQALAPGSSASNLASLTRQSDTTTLAAGTLEHTCLYFHKKNICTCCDTTMVPNFTDCLLQSQPAVELHLLHSLPQCFLLCLSVDEECL